MPEGLTLAQIQAMGGTPVAPPTQASQGLTLAQLQGMGARPSVAPVAPTASPVNPNMGQLDAQNVEEGAQNIIGSIEGGAAKIQKGEEQGGLGGLGEAAIGAGEAGLGTASGAVQAIFAPFTAALQDVANRTGVHPIEALQTTAFGQKVAQLSQEHPEAAKNISDALNVIGAVLGSDVAPATDVGDGVAEAATAAKDSVAAVGKVPTAIGNVAKSEVVKIFPNLSTDPDAILKNAADEWAAPAETNLPSHKVATAILAKDPTIPNTLANLDLSPYDHVENDIYHTSEAAQNIREMAGQRSSDLLRPSLQQEDYGVVKTPVSEIVGKAITSAKTDPTITPDDIESISTIIEKKGEALERKYPNGMSLTDMHDNKITYAKNGGYKPSSIADNNTAIANRSFGHALGDTVEAKATNLPVSEINEQLQHYYRAADYLDALNGKKAPVSLGKIMIRGAARYAGAGLAAHLGGGLVSEFAGYQIAKNVERLLENLTSPARAIALRNIKITQPKIFDSFEKYLNDTKNGNPLRLKAPDSDTPIQLPAPAEKPQQASQPAKKMGYPLPRDPRTGKIFRAYSSESE